MLTASRNTPRKRKLLGGAKTVVSLLGTEHCGYPSSCQDGNVLVFCGTAVRTAFVDSYVLGKLFRKMHE